MKKIKKVMMILCTTVAVAAFGVSSYGMVSNAQNEDDTEAWVSFEDADWEDEAAEDETISYGEKKTDRSVDATEMVDMETTEAETATEEDTQEPEQETEVSEDTGKTSGTGVDDNRNVGDTTDEKTSEEPEYKYDTGYIFMGDSRIYLMNEDCSINGVPNFFAVCCPGIGYDWMIETGLPKIRSIQSSHTEIKSWVILSALGINDMENINQYLRTYRSLAKTTNLWLVSINPTEGRSEPQYNNVCINAFNKRLQTVSGVTYINSHDYLVNKGYSTKDGVHYTELCNWDIYSYYLTSLLAGRDSMPDQSATSKELAQSLVRQLSQENK
jgi:hypothetical protein